MQRAVLQLISFFFFQAEDGIRDATVTGVQTCALPIYAPLLRGGGTERTGSATRSRAQGGDRGRTAERADRARGYRGADAGRPDRTGMDDQRPQASLPRHRRADRAR